jgi:hypothetical protein
VSVAFREILWEPLTESLGTSNARLPQEEENGDPISDKNRFCMYTSREYESAEDERLRATHVPRLQSRGWRVVGHRYLAMRFLPNASIFSATTEDPRTMTDATMSFLLLLLPSFPRCTRFPRMIVRISINLRKIDLIAETIVVTVYRQDGRMTEITSN